MTVDRLTDRKESRRLTVQVEHVFKDTQVASEADIKRQTDRQTDKYLSLIHISEPTRLLQISYAVFCLKKNFF